MIAYNILIIALAVIAVIIALTLMAGFILTIIVLVVPRGRVSKVHEVKS